MEAKVDKDIRGWSPDDSFSWLKSSSMVTVKGRREKGQEREKVLGER